MTKFGITFNGKHSYKDYGLRVLERKIGNPSKMKRKKRAPYSNEVHDFSGVYGGQEYEERELSYTFQIKEADKLRLNIFETAITNWLTNNNQKTRLLDDYVDGYYFMAEVETAIDYTELQFSGQFSVTFTADSFKKSILPEGHDIFKEFNFLLDYAQDVDFTIEGSKEITLYNNGANIIVPTVIASEPMEIILGNTQFSVPAGKSKHDELVLANLKNNLTIKGNGTISFEFYKELI